MVSFSIEQLPITLNSGTEYNLPYYVVNSGNDGLSVLVTACMHGNEIQGAEIIRRILPELRQSLCAGKVILLPFANPIAVKKRQPHIDYELHRSYSRDRENNYNCTWPGNADGNDTQRTTYAVFQEIIPQCDYLFDLHCWYGNNAACILARYDKELNIKFSEASSLRFARGSHDPQAGESKPFFPCTLSQYFNDNKQGGVCIEFSGQYCFRKREIQNGVISLLNGFKIFGMLPGEPENIVSPTIWTDKIKKLKLKLLIPEFSFRMENWSWMTR
jgi:predicted deacylase